MAVLRVRTSQTVYPDWCAGMSASTRATAALSTACQSVIARKWRPSLISKSPASTGDVLRLTIMLASMTREFIISCIIIVMCYGSLIIKLPQRGTCKSAT